MKIAMVAPTHIPALRANTVQVMKMAQAMVELGHDLLLLSPGDSAHPAGKDQADWEEMSQHYGLRVRFPVEWLPARPALRRYDYGIQALRRAREWGAGLLYTRLPQAAAWSSQAGLATIFEVHDLPRGLGARWLFRRFLTGQGARRLVVITRALANDLKALSKKPLESPFAVIAPDGVDLERFAGLPGPGETRRRLMVRQPGSPERFIELPPTRFTAGYTGHLYPGRGADLLLALAEQLPEITFLLVGGEPQDVARMQAECAQRSLQNLILTGFVPNAYLPEYQAACDVLLMPYQRQIAASSGGDIARYLSPMKLFEYLASGRAILSSDLRPLREVLNRDNAMLLPPDQIEAWIYALREMQAKPQLCQKLANQAREDAAQYTWKARTTRILTGVQEAGS